MEKILPSHLIRPNRFAKMQLIENGSAKRRGKRKGRDRYGGGGGLEGRE